MRFLTPILPLMLLPALAATAQVPAPKSANNPAPRPATTSPAVTTPSAPSLMAAGAQPALPDSLTGPASTQYRRGAIGRFFLGSHHRATWEMPVTVPAFRPDILFGGLTPVKEGGSMQTLNLRMVTKDGHQYVLRSVDKDIKRALGEGEHNGPGARVLQDQMAAVHPYGALLAASLAESAGIYHATPQLYRVPTDRNVLGDFQKDFAGKLVYLEERPDGDWTGQNVFGNAMNVVSSEKMLRDRYSDAYHQLGARQYLRARLFDILIGDWSRREDQWRWALHTRSAADNKFVPGYVAVPRDRDHAFSRYSDGVFPGLAVLFKRKVVSFGPKIGTVSRYVKTSETLDHVVLGWLTEDDFKAEALALQIALTDDALDRALTHWPTNIQRLEGRKFRQHLQARRQQLPAAAAELYRYLAKDVVLPASDSTDVFTLSPGANGNVTVTWVSSGRPKAGSAEAWAGPYKRTFNLKETKTISIYALAGADRIELTAPLPKDGPQLEFFDGPGEDVATRKDGVETPKWLRLRASGDRNAFDSLPEWCRKPDADTRARDYDAAGFLLRHRLD